MPVVLVSDEKLPPLLLVHVITCPAVGTACPCASASCAVIVTVPPATTLDALDVTRYCVGCGGPPVVVIDALLPVICPVAAVTT